MAKDSTERSKRAGVGYLLRMYPRFSQTFVVNEILELERQGMDLRIASLRLPNEGRFHESVARVRAPADYLPDRVIGRVGPTLSRQLSALRRSPRRYAKAMALLGGHRTERWFELVQAAELLRWARKNRIGHVHVHFGTDEATVALLANLMGGPGYSLTLHAFDIFRNNVDRRLLARKINSSRFTITVCESNRRFLLEEVPGVQPSKIHVLYNGIDVQRFSPNGVQREPASVFSVGRLIEKKGFIHLVRAVGRLKARDVRVSCRIAGDGPERGKLEREIRRLELTREVRLVGALEQEAVRKEMQRATCFVLPCVRAADGNVDALPTVLLEAMACGCPAISTTLSGIPEIIESDLSGLLVPPGDDFHLATAVERVLADAVLQERLSEGGRRRAHDRFNIRANVSRLRDMLQAGGEAQEAPRSQGAGREMVPDEALAGLRAAS